MPSKANDKKRNSGRLSNRLATPDAYSEFVANIDECKGKLVRIEKDYRKNLHSVLAMLCAEATKLVDDGDLWAKFREDPRWGIKRPVASDQENAARYVLQWACDGTRDGKRNASFYWRAMKPLIRERVPPAKIPDAIVRRGGLKKLSTASDVRNSKPLVGHEDEKSDKPTISVNNDGMKPDKKPVTSEEPLPYKSVVANINADFNKHIATWRRIKKGTCFEIYGELENMSGPTARIRIVDLVVHDD